MNKDLGKQIVVIDNGYGYGYGDGSGSSRSIKADDSEIMLGQILLAQHRDTAARCLRFNQQQRCERAD